MIFFVPGHHMQVTSIFWIGRQLVTIDSKMYMYKFVCVYTSNYILETTIIGNLYRIRYDKFSERFGLVSN